MGTRVVPCGRTDRQTFDEAKSRCNRLFELPDFGYNYLYLVVCTDPSQGIYRGN